jgi:hypothetical protein
VLQKCFFKFNVVTKPESKKMLVCY